MAIDKLKPRPVIPQTARVKDVALPTPPPNATSIVPDIFAKKVQPANLQLDGARAPDAGRKELAHLQASRPLWGVSDNAELTAVGNPFLIIPFSTAAEVAATVFKRDLSAGYDLAVPQNAVALGEDRVFVASLRRRDGAEAPQSRALLVDSQGALRGAECRTPEEVKDLFTRAGSLGDRVKIDAFGADTFQKSGERISLVSVKRGKESAFEATLSLGKQEATVRLNNFGLAVPPAKNPSALDIVLARLRLDAFEAVA
ncbi:MAG: hypothetical protein ACOZIN_01920 [Myxococcota bacterium]